MDVIEKLKKNMAKFGYMTWQEKEIITVAYREKTTMFLDHEGRWLSCGCAGYPCDDERYRLTSDYKPEPKIIECEVKVEDYELWYYREGNPFPLSNAVNCPNCRGFRMTDGSIIPEPRWLEPDGALGIPTHVLFLDK